MSRGISVDARPNLAEPTARRRWPWLISAALALSAIGLGQLRETRTLLGLSGDQASPDPAARAPNAPPAQQLADSLRERASRVRDYWSSDFGRRGLELASLTMSLHPKDETTRCGADEQNAGSFYCSQDRTLHLDLGTYRSLFQLCPRYAEAAESYIVAHTTAHHVQTSLGLDTRVAEVGKAHKGQQYAMQVRLELQADCFAGVWSRMNKQPIRPADFDAAQSCAASSIEQARERQDERSPAHESLNHGSTRQRLFWFTTGFNSGRIQDCDTFAPPQP
ncbi:MAG TPA: neutral zinc metallopeptidase [Polyangiaceae bacterium]|jgi:hypothetical protein|nr:neutral zinc metallopeptidase [Polyangiaceae bacterium]